MADMVIDAPRQAGIYVRRARERRGLTRAQLAQSAGVSERSLASLELGDATGMRLDKLIAIISALGLKLVARDEGASADAAREPDDASPRVTATPSPVRAAPAPTEGGGPAAPKVPSIAEHLALLREVSSEQLRDAER